MCLPGDRSRRGCTVLPLRGSASHHIRYSPCDPGSYHDLHDHYWIPRQCRCVSDCLPETCHAFGYQSAPRHVGLFRHNAVSPLHALHCRYSGQCWLELWERVLPGVHHALLAVCPRRGVNTPHHQRGPLPHHRAAAGQVDASQSEALDRGLMGAEPVRVSALCGWLEEGVGKDRGYLGTTVRARLLRLRGRPWIHRAAGSGCLLCAIRRHALLLPVYSQHGTPQHH